MSGGAGTELIVIHVRHQAAEVRRRWTILCVILISILAGFLPRPLRAAPADATDKDTQQSLKDLDAIETPKVTSTRTDSDQSPGIHWGQLIHLFDFMLATAAALGVSASVLGLFVVRFISDHRESRAGRGRPAKAFRGRGRCCRARTGGDRGSHPAPRRGHLRGALAPMAPVRPGPRGGGAGGAAAFAMGYAVSCTV